MILFKKFLSLLDIFFGIRYNIAVIVSIFGLAARHFDVVENDRYVRELFTLDGRIDLVDEAKVSFAGTDDVDIAIDVLIEGHWIGNDKVWGRVEDDVIVDLAKLCD